MRWRITIALSILLILSAAELVEAERQLTLGSLVLKLGASDSAILQQLTTDFDVRRFDGGLDIQRRGDPTAPSIGVLTAGGQIEAVQFIWGPGFTPPAEKVCEQLIEALPAHDQCQVQTVTRPQEGGVVRTVEWTCGGYKVRLVTGVYPQGGNTGSISIDRR